MKVSAPNSQMRFSASTSSQERTVMRDAPGEVVTSIRSDGEQGIWRLGRWALWLSMVSAWIIQAVAARHTLDADGVSYLDIATAFWQGNWHAAINGYWSPAYPVLLGLWL